MSHSDVTKKSHWGKKRHSFSLPFFSQINSPIFLKPISRQIIKRYNACWSSLLVRFRRVQKCFGRDWGKAECAATRGFSWWVICFGIHSLTLRQTYVRCWNVHSVPNSVWCCNMIYISWSCTLWRKSLQMLEAWNIPAFWNVHMRNVTKLNYHFTDQSIHCSEEQREGGSQVPTWDKDLKDLYWISKWQHDNTNCRF